MAVAVDGTTFDLAEGWNQLKLPPTVTGKTLGNVLRRLPYWQQLMAEYEARSEWLRPYSFRDTFSVRTHGIVMDDTLIAAARCTSTVCPMAATGRQSGGAYGRLLRRQAAITRRPTQSVCSRCSNSNI